MAKDERGQTCVPCITGIRREGSKGKRERGERTLGDSCPSYCLFMDAQPVGQEGAAIQLPLYFEAAYLRQE